MSISELNHLMTYVIEGWALFSLGSVSLGFVSFVSRRIQEDLEAEALSQADETVVEADVELKAKVEDVEAADVARLEEVAAVSEQLAKTNDSQSDGSSVSVSV
ncbi:MAG: hypothetical protein AAF716_05840 [Cyanobacteria bacterium P01_D01_bin.1]